MAKTKVYSDPYGVRLGVEGHEAAERVAIKLKITKGEAIRRAIAIVDRGVTKKQYYAGEEFDTEIRRTDLLSH